MLKKLVAVLLALFTFAAMAAVDVNKATPAELDGVKGIGPAIAGKIVAERQKGAFKDWQDFIDRVKGVGEGNAAKLSAEGLTVNGATFKGVAAAPTAKKDDKPAATPAPTAAPAPAKAMTADEKKAAAKKEKEEKAAAKKKEAEEKKAAKAAKAEEAKKAKADKAAAAKAAKEGKDGKPAAAAASAAKK